MLHQSLRATTWAVALAAISALSPIDPPADAERALLGRTPTHESGSSNLRMTRPEGPVSAGRALLGQRTTSQEAVAADQAIQIRSRRADGPGALLGRP
jgi:hypothetical protein